ncbi:MAG: helix-turn-helix transcriptional regulator [Lachnospiraceae bacterium]|nr:helix-turn-helix transcriptional regulator [Lachnospiraceae bacterium]
MDFDLNLIKERLKETFGDDTQVEIGKRISSSQANVSKMLSGTQDPTIETVYRIAQEYDVSVDWLLGLSDVKKRTTSIKTYGDVLKTFVLLGEAGIIWPFPNNMISVDGRNPELPEVTFLGVNDEILHSLLYEWKRMMQSPKDIYDMWMEKRIEEYSSIPYIPWSDDARELYNEVRDPVGVSIDVLKAFYAAYTERFEESAAE